MMEKLVQSVELKSLSVYRLKRVKAASSIEGVTVTISIGEEARKRVGIGYISETERFAFIS